MNRRSVAFEIASPILFFFCLSPSAQGRDRFGPQILIQQSDLSSPSCAAAADLDGDGDGDVVVSSWSDNQIAWYENLDGSGRFGLKRVISDSVPNAIFVTGTDLDGDGDTDVLSLAETKGEMAWFENLDGNGSFGPIRVIGDSVVQCIPCDTDGDGDRDIVTLFTNSGLGLFVNLEITGRFGRAGTIRDSLGFVSHIDATDMDGDGDPDILVGNKAGTDTSWMWFETLHRAAGFRRHAVPTAVFRQIEPEESRICAADVDGDGDQDVILASYYHEGDKPREDFGLCWFENCDGRGEFGPPQVITKEIGDVLAVHPTDVDGDGDPDLVTATEEWLISWWENRNGEISVRHTIRQKLVLPRSVCSFDLDGDGDPDVLSATWLDDKVAWYENEDGLGGFGGQRPVSGTSAWIESVCPADLDGDGDQDVLSGAAYVSWNENLDGRGTFGTQRVIGDHGFGPVRVLAGDFDGNGTLDVLSASEGDQSLAWYRNEDGNGSFGYPRIISTGMDGPPSVFAADLDGDADLDVLSAEMVDDRIVWFRNEGGGNFGPEVVIDAEADDPTCVCAADLDGDLDLDVLSSSSDNDRIAWRENLDGKGVFGPERIISIEEDYARSVCAADIDGDGDMDALSASWWDDTVAWHENLDGQGSFGNRRVVSSQAEKSSSASACDVDNDGDLDVLSVSEADYTIGWFENLDGNGAFGNRQTITSDAMGAHSAATADLDGDGDPDLLTTSVFNANVAWHQNLTVETGTERENPDVPGRCELFQNYPNPFNPATAIRYSLQESADVTLAIFNSSGQRVRILDCGEQGPGTHSLVWDATDGEGKRLPGGLYLCVLKAGDAVLTKKMMAVK